MFSSCSLFKHLTTQQLQLVLTRRLLCETITIQDGDMENPFQNNENNENTITQRESHTTVEIRNVMKKKNSIKVDKNVHSVI